MSNAICCVSVTGCGGSLWITWGLRVSSPAIGENCVRPRKSLSSGWRGAGLRGTARRAPINRHTVRVSRNVEGRLTQKVNVVVSRRNQEVGLKTNWFGAEPAQRLSHRRDDREWLDTQLHAVETCFVPVWRARNLVRMEGPGAAAAHCVNLRALLEAGADRDELVFLGISGGRAYFSAALPADADPAALIGSSATSFADLREMGGLLTPAEAFLFSFAGGMALWHERHRYCGSCGAPTISETGGHVRACSAQICGTKHFPRTDPAVIVLTLAGKPGDAAQRCLLGRPRHWAPGLYSTVAGFVEPGESIEQAVRREVAEETGVQVEGVHYHSSQPWPFPSSLMLGFHAHARVTDIALVDDELEDACWFTREQLTQRMAAGEVRLPRSISIAYRLIEDWFDRGNHGVLIDWVGGR